MIPARINACIPLLLVALLAGCASGFRSKPEFEQYAQGLKLVGLGEEAAQAKLASEGFAPELMGSGGARTRLFRRVTRDACNNEQRIGLALREGKVASVNPELTLTCPP